jgi:hypothetical protein
MRSEYGLPSSFAAQSTQEEGAQRKGLDERPAASQVLPNKAPRSQTTNAAQAAAVPGSARRVRLRVVAAQLAAVAA